MSEETERLHKQINELEQCRRLLGDPDFQRLVQRPMEIRCEQALERLLNPKVTGLDVEHARNAYLEARAAARHLPDLEAALFSQIDRAQRTPAKKPET